MMVWLSYIPQICPVFRLGVDHTGLVSVKSAQWGTYKGTLVGPSHLDIINWSNRLKWVISEAIGTKRQ